MLRALDLKPLESSEAQTPGRAAYRFAFLVTAISVGVVYVWFAQTANQKLGWSTGSAGYYNYLARGFANGHLYLPMEPAPELLALPDPWDPERNQPYRAQDLVLYHRRYYLYHGATPAVLLFTPWRMATGKDLPEASAALAFAFFGYVFSCGVLLRLLSWTKVRPSVPWLVALLLAVGLCPAIPYLLLRVKVYEVAILGGYFCMSAGFWFLAKAVLATETAPRAYDPGWSHVRAGHRLPSALRCDRADRGGNAFAVSGIPRTLAAGIFFAGHRLPDDDRPVQLRPVSRPAGVWDALRNGGVQLLPAGPVFKECRTGIVLLAGVPARSIAGISFCAPGVAPSF